MTTTNGGTSIKLKCGNSLIYGIPFVLYDRNDRLVLRKKLDDILSVRG